MHISYKFGLFLIFILSISFYHTRAAPATTPSSTEDDYEYSDDDYYDDNDEKSIGEQNYVKPTKKATTSIFSFLNIPQRNNHVVEPTCPTDCLCLEDYKFINCAHAGLSQVPHDLPTTAIILDLSHNQLKEIKKTDFAHRTRLQEINLGFNQIENITMEAFTDLPKLRRLRLNSNLIHDIDPDLFQGAPDLSLLDLSNNSIVLRNQNSFLNQPSLLELNCRNCSWSEIYDDTFKNISNLNALRIDQNNFNKKINTRAFTPLKNLIKLRIPELDQSSIEKLCNLLKFIDNISFKHFDVSCYELVLGTSYNESIILATDPPYKRPNIEISTLPAETTVTGKTNTAAAPAAEKDSSSSMSSNNFSTFENETEILVASIGGGGSSTTLRNNNNIDNESEKEQAYQVPVSQETINIMLISLMIISVIGIIIGVICRRDVGGIKTKCCRTKKTTDTDDMKATSAASANGTNGGLSAEEIPLNKLSA